MAKMRRRAGLTQVELARRAELHASQICLWERGQIELKPEQESRILAVLHEHIADFMKSILAGGQYAVSR